MKILVVDDHALFREALHNVVAEVDGSATVLEAADHAEAAGTLRDHPDLDLVLLDLGLPDRDGFGVLAELRQRHPAISVVVLSANNDRDNVVKALNLGAQGFIPKSARREVMLGALNLVLAGGIYIPPDILERDDRPSLSAARKALSQTAASGADFGLTDRQLEVLALMRLGKSNKAICRALELAEPTVKNHVTAILKALKVSNRTEAVIKAEHLGFALPLPQPASR